jgi:hypothetical protein
LDQNSPDQAETGNGDSPNAEQDGNLSQRINGLMGTLGKRTQERDTALRELEAVRAQLASSDIEDDEPEPVRIDPNNPRRGAPRTPSRQPTAAELKDQLEKMPMPDGWDTWGR